jgi:hypothetical protein
MAKLPAVVRSLNIADFPDMDPKLMSVINNLMSNTVDALGGGANQTTGGQLTFGDNFACNVKIIKVSHGVPFNVTPSGSLKQCRGVIPLGADLGQVVVGLGVQGITSGVQITVFFSDPTVINTNVGLLLLSEGIVGSTAINYTPAWVAPTFAGTWANFGSGNLPAGYMKDANGFVHLRGAIATGTINTTAFTLPAGYRPSLNVNFACASNSAFGYLSITSAGVVNPAVGSNVWFSLDGITFDTR